MARDEIPETYASPNLRWALLLEDHPGATYEFDSMLGREIGLPDGWGADEEHCVCTIRFPAESGLQPIVAWKSVESELHVTRWVNGRKTQVTLERSSDLWNVICTKTLGRALKRAGYPDDMNELKGLMAWRRRLAELSAVGAAPAPPPAVGAGEHDQALAELEAAGKPDPEDVGHEERVYAPDDPERPFDVEPVEPAAPAALFDEPSAAPAGDTVEEPPSDELLAEVRQALNAAAKVPGMQKELRAAAKAVGISVANPATATDADWIIDWVRQRLPEVA